MKTTVILIFLLSFLLLTNSEDYESESDFRKNEDVANIAGGEGKCEGKGGAGDVAKDSKEASNIAIKAAQEAKAAENAQATAGQQASHQVKEQLAEKALEAAKAADAALAGKEALVEQLEKEIDQAGEVINEETNSLQELQNTQQAAGKALQESKAEVKLLTTALQLAEGNAQSAIQAEEGVKQQEQEKEQLLEAAKQRKEELGKQQDLAKQDYANTKEASKKAEQAAAEAKQNVSKGRKKRNIRSKRSLRSKKEKRQISS